MCLFSMFSVLFYLAYEDVNWVFISGLSSGLELQCLAWLTLDQAHCTFVVLHEVGFDKF